MTLRQRVELCIGKLVLRLLVKFAPIHDSWSPPTTPEQQRLLRLRLEQLKPRSKAN